MINIAIDGPSGAGKSTIAKRVAKELGYIYVDTGALYRAIGLNAVRHCVDTKDENLVAETLKDITLELKFIDGSQRVLLNGEDVSQAIRTPDVSMAASDVSAAPCVRDFLFNLQRTLAENNNCLMDGRDIGTVVLPDADVKIYLTASADERAKRRFNEFLNSGEEVTMQSVKKQMKERDYQDSNRKVAPLKPARDAIVVDSTDKTLQQVVDMIIELAKGKAYG
ncbi:MAG: (d)CMP kinase [Oscillospiraceae bacterium]|jgi:cytidylate kinase|nr:(d)CMP kinase [Oscillospiraceae bacterium]